MKPFPLPVVGAGSQPDDEPLQYLASPGAMQTFRMPTPSRTAAAPADIEAARRLLGALQRAMELATFGDAQAPGLDLRELPGAVAHQVNELLGQGEVSCRVDAPNEIRIQETAFAAIWRLCEFDGAGRLVADRVETGAIPARVREVLRAQAPGTPRPSINPLVPGVMNAPSLLHEILQSSDESLAAGEGAPARVLNLTLLPVSNEDLEQLTAALGPGPVTILSRGYGNCRISSTGVPRVWWVQYYNSMDQLILNTIEVVTIPEVALAAREDYEDSVERLAEWLAADEQ